MEKSFDKTVADVATQRKQYVPPQIEVVELDNQGAILMASTGSGSGTAGWGNSLSGDDYEE